jgi:hypothetical protein
MRIVEESQEAINLKKQAAEVHLEAIIGRKSHDQHRLERPVKELIDLDIDPVYPQQERLGHKSFRRHAHHLAIIVYKTPADKLIIVLTVQTIVFKLNLAEGHHC